MEHDQDGRTDPSGEPRAEQPAPVTEPPDAGSPDAATAVPPPVNLPESSSFATLPPGPLPATVEPGAVPGGFGAPAPMPPPPPEGTGAGTKKVVWLLVGLVALAGIILGGYFLWRKTGGGGGRPFETAARHIPKDSPGFLSIDDPSALLEVYGNAAAKSPDFKRAMDMVALQSKQAIGFDVTTPSGWEDGGFDPSAPICAGMLSVPGPDQRYEFLASVGVVSEGRALESIRKILTSGGLSLEKDSEGDPVVYRARYGFGTATTGPFHLAFKDSRAFFLITDRPGVKPPDRLREVLRLAPADSLLADPEFKQVTARCTTTGMSSVFVNLKAVVRAATGGKPNPLWDSFRSMAAASGDEAGTLYLSLEPGSGLLEFLKPGGSCTEMLSRLEKPFAAFSLSLANPVGFYRFIAESVGEGSEVEQNTHLLEEVYGIRMADLEELTRNCALSVAVYLGPDLFALGTRGARPDVVGVAEVKDPARARQVLSAVAAAGRLREQPAVAGVLYVSDDPQHPWAIGLSGKYLVGGNSVARVEGACRATVARWAPHPAEGSLISLEMHLGDLLKGLPEAVKRQAGGILDSFIGEDALVTYQAVRKDNGLQLDVLTKGVNPAFFLMAGSVAAYLLPTMGDRPPRRVSEASTAAMLRNIASAQVAYSSKLSNEGQYGSFADLAGQGFLDSRFKSEEPVIDGFQFSLSTDGKLFTCAAVGTEDNAGKRYFINNDLVVCKDPACREPLQ
ncbi:MAG: hypothetical protein KA419_05750 [Acidobacteria bacterium]|nr:hypothetical protein [Acidobacteriota bacterium]